MPHIDIIREIVNFFTYDILHIEETFIPHDGLEKLFHFVQGLMPHSGAREDHRRQFLLVAFGERRLLFLLGNIDLQKPRNGRNWIWWSFKISVMYFQAIFNRPE